MDTWQMAVESLRRPKLHAVREAASAIAPLLGEGVSLEVAGYEIDSGVGHTPTSGEELMHGARRRAESLQTKLIAENSSANFYVGLEGGLDVMAQSGRRNVFLQSWAYVTDGERGHFGCSGSIEIPERLADEVLAKGVELAQAIDQYAGAVGIRDSQGAWGILSAQLISRQESFRLAVITAFAPFYNAHIYGTASAAAR